MDTLNLLDNEDISQLTWEEIKKIFKKNSRSSSKKGKSRRNSTPQLAKSTPPSISKSRLGTMMEYMKTKILHSLAMKMERMQLKMKREEAEKALAIFFPKCKKKHERNEFPMDIVEIRGIFYEKHPTDKCPFLPPLKCVLIGASLEKLVNLYFT